MFRVATSVTLLLCAIVALAQPAPTVRVRGDVEALDGQTLTVKARDGSQLSVRTAENFTVGGLKRGGELHRRRLEARIARRRRGRQIRRCRSDAATRRNASRARNADLPRRRARHERRPWTLGSAAAEHDDQREGRRGRFGARGPRADTALQGRREATARAGKRAGRRCCAGRSVGARAGGAHLHICRPAPARRHTHGFACHRRARWGRSADVTSAHVITPAASNAV